MQIGLWVLLSLAFVPVEQAIGQNSQPATATSSCRSDSTFRYLDFWVGHWTVVDDSSRVEDGTDVVERIVDGCAIVENWHGSDGGEGKSLFYFVPWEHRWKQVWVTTQALLLGGLKEKRLVWRGADGSVRFQGELVGERGGVLMDRTTLSPLDSGTVRQIIEQSSDGGTHWVQVYHATYIRDGRAPSRRQ